MSDATSNDAAAPTTQLREEVEHELDEMAEEAKEQEAERMDKRDEAGVDEPT